MFWRIQLSTLLMSVLLISNGIGKSKHSPEFQAAVEAVKLKKFEEAIQLFEGLALGQDHTAQFNLAVLYKSGKGRPQNFAKALSWCWLSYLGGITKAQEFCQDLLPLLPPGAIEVVRDEVKSNLEYVVEEGNSEAILQLAKYHIEILEEPDYIAAFKWQSIAAALNINRAAKLRDETATNLSIDEIHAVQQETFTLFDQNNYADKFSKTTDEKN